MTTDICLHEYCVTTNRRIVARLQDPIPTGVGRAMLVDGPIQISEPIILQDCINTTYGGDLFPMCERDLPNIKVLYFTLDDPCGSHKLNS